MRASVGASICVDHEVVEEVVPLPEDLIAAIICAHKQAHHNFDFLIKLFVLYDQILVCLWHNLLDSYISEREVAASDNG